MDEDREIEGTRVPLNFFEGGGGTVDRPVSDISEWIKREVLEGRRGMCPS